MTAIENYAASITDTFVPGIRVKVVVGTVNRNEYGTVIGTHTNTGSGLPAVVVTFDSGHTDSMVLPESLTVIPFAPTQAEIDFNRLHGPDPVIPEVDSGFRYHPMTGFHNS